MLLSILNWVRNSGMFGTEGDGEENGNGLSALCSGVLCLFPLNWKSRYLYCFLVMWWTIPKKTSRKFLLIGHSLHRQYKIRIDRGVPNGFAVFLSHSGKKRTIPMIVYLFKVSYDSLWCQSLMVWYTAFLPATPSILYVKSTQNFQQIHKLTFI